MRERLCKLCTYREGRPGWTPTYNWKMLGLALIPRGSAEVIFFATASRGFGNLHSSSLSSGDCLSRAICSFHLQARLSKTIPEASSERMGENMYIAQCHGHALFSVQILLQFEQQLHLDIKAIFTTKIPSRGTDSYMHFLAIIYIAKRGCYVTPTVVRVASHQQPRLTLCTIS